MRLRLALIVLALAGISCAVQVSPPVGTPPPPTATAAATPSAIPTATEARAEAETATVRAALVNVRATPEGEVVGQLQAGTDVLIIECRDGWCHIQEPDGWIWQGCLSNNDGKGCEAR